MQGKMLEMKVKAMNKFCATRKVSSLKPALRIA